MKNRISLLFSGANTTLKPLGKSLFYLYITLFFLGCAGIIFSISTIVLKIANIGSATTTPWWEITMLLVVSWYTIKTFINESYNLIGKDKLQTQSKTPSPAPMLVINHHTPSNSNVIPFVKKNEKNL